MSNTVGPRRRGRAVPSAAAALICLAGTAGAVAAERIQAKQDDADGRLTVKIDGNEAFSYFHGEKLDLPYIVPKSPAGREMTVVKTNPYPHHRSIWFADKVQLTGQRVTDFYNALYSQADKKDPNSLFRSRIRHVKFARMETQADRALVEARLVWEMDGKTGVLDEDRTMRITALGGGEYLLDVTFALTASYGDVTFVSDAVHYAWPYVRMHPEFSVQKGGRITSSEGGVDQKGTHGTSASWMDYSNTTGGKNAGLAVLIHPADKPPRKWLTRDYGTLGPRRPDERSGKRFTITKGQGIRCRVGFLVHRGDVKAGKVAERYAEYCLPQQN